MSFQILRAKVLPLAIALGCSYHYTSTTDCRTFSFHQACIVSVLNMILLNTSGPYPGTFGAIAGKPNTMRPISTETFTLCMPCFGILPPTMGLRDSRIRDTHRQPMQVVNIIYRPIHRVYFNIVVMQSFYMWSKYFDYHNYSCGALAVCSILSLCISRLHPKPLNYTQETAVPLNKRSRRTFQRPITNLAAQRSAAGTIRH